MAIGIILLPYPNGTWQGLVRLREQTSPTEWDVLQFFHSFTITVRLVLTPLMSVHPKTFFSVDILRSISTKNLVAPGFGGDSSLRSE